jgi:hypothetical protein
VARRGVLRAGSGLRVRRPVVLGGVAGLVVLLGGCSAGTSRVEACVEHSVEEGIDAAAAQVACEGAVGDDG